MQTQRRRRCGAAVASGCMQGDGRATFSQGHQALGELLVR